MNPELHLGLVRVNRTNYTKTNSYHRSVSVNQAARRSRLERDRGSSCSLRNQNQTGTGNPHTTPCLYNPSQMKAASMAPPQPGINPQAWVPGPRSLWPAQPGEEGKVPKVPPPSAQLRVTSAPSKRLSSQCPRRALVTTCC